MEHFSHSGVGSDFDPRPEISCSGPVWGRISKKICSAVAREHAWSMIIKQIFSPMHTAGSTGPESKKLSNQVKSGQKLQCPGAALGW